MFLYYVILFCVCVFYFSIFQCTYCLHLTFFSFVCLWCTCMFIIVINLRFGVHTFLPHKVIDNLENKNSSGHDGISNTLLKIIKNDISQSLTIIINQMLTTGIFPDVLSYQKSFHYSRKVILPFWLITDLSRYCQQYQRFSNESFTI